MINYLITILIVVLILQFIFLRKKIDQNSVLVLFVVTFLITTFINNKEFFIDNPVSEKVITRNSGPSKISQIQALQSKDIDLIEQQLKLVNSIHQDKISNDTLSYKKIPIENSCAIPTANEKMIVNTSNQSIPYFIDSNISGEDLAKLVEEVNKKKTAL